MADRYVKNTGSNTSPYDTWAKAATTLQAACTGSANGDRIFVSSAHTQSATNYTNAFGAASTSAIPAQIYSVNDSAEPPTALAAGATITTTAGRLIWNNIGFTRVSGLTLASGGDLLTFFGSRPIFENCTFRLNVSGAQIHTNDNAPVSDIRWVNCWFNPTFSNQVITSAGGLIWTGGGLLAGSAAITSLLGVGRAPMYLDSLDLSAAASNLDISTSGDSRAFARISNSKLPASWTGDVQGGGVIGIGSRFEMFNCDSGSTNYRLRIRDYAGTIRDETTIVRTGGASDGATPLSWKMVSNTNASFGVSPLRSSDIAVWNDAVGNSKTVTIEVITDNVTLTDKECWLDVVYLSETGNPLGTIASDACGLLSTPANQTGSSETWTTTGLTTPIKQKLSVTFTPQKVGFIYAVVHLARASTTVYVDPKITVT